MIEPAAVRSRFGHALLTAALGFVLLQPITAARGAAAGQRPVTVRIDASTVVRELPDRALFGQNFTFTSSANETWDAERGRFREPFWTRFRAINPGLLRFPGGNWCYGFHFNLARRGIPHWVNSNVVTPAYRPQDFLATLHELSEAVALLHLSPIWSSPEEAAALVAYFVGDTSDSRRIGIDSWGRIDPETSGMLDWETVGHWAQLRESDGRDAYTRTLYFMVGNEEWFAWSPEAGRGARADYYGRLHPTRQMTVEDGGRVDPSSGVEIEAYWENYRATYLKVRELFGTEQVRIGALAHARPDGVGGADAFLRTSGGGGKRWNVELLDNLNRDPVVTADFLAIHVYHYDRHGWQNHFPDEGAANLLFASDHLAARIDAIFEYAQSPKYPVMVTEFNTHLSGAIPPSSLLNALFYVDVTVSALRDPDVIGMARWQVALSRHHEAFDGAALFATDTGRLGDGRLWKMGPYYAAQLLGNLHQRVVSMTIEGAPTFRPRELTGEWIAGDETRPWWTASDLPVVVGAATLSDDGKHLAVLILNKQTTRTADLLIHLDGFAPASTFTEILLDTQESGGHEDLFKINPWRLAQGASCVPASGGCTSLLASESSENVSLSVRLAGGASTRFPLRVAPHAAALLRLVRAGGKDTIFPESAEER
jgi:hypothetical protein